MAIVRIGTTPAKKNEKPDRYLNQDITRKNKKYKKILIGISILCAISLILNGILLYKK